MIELKETYDPPYNLWYGVKHKNLLRFKITYGGSLPNASALPPKALMPGVMFHMENDGSNYMWNGVAWDKMDSNPFVGATSSANGIQGLVPQPKKANREGFLYGGGGWKDLDASDVKTGVFDLARIPAAAMERLVTVADQTERYTLTTSTVQNGDSVLQSDTHVMYRVVDQTELDNSNGYVEYQAATANVVPWSGITGTPGTFTPSAHTHVKEDITDLPEVIPQNIYIDPVNGNDTNTGYSADSAFKTLYALRSKLENANIITAKYLNVYLAEGNYNEDLAGVANICLIFRAPTTANSTATFKSLISAEQANVTLLGNYTTSQITVVRNGYMRLANGCNITFDRSLITTNGDIGCLIFIYQNGTCVTYSGSSVTFNIKGNWTITNGLYQIITGGVAAFWGNETWNVLTNSSFTGPKYNIASCGIGNSILSSSLPGSTGSVDSTSFVN